MDGWETHQEFRLRYGCTCLLVLSLLSSWMMMKNSKRAEQSVRFCCSCISMRRVAIPVPVADSSSCPPTSEAVLADLSWQLLSHQKGGPVFGLRREGTEMIHPKNTPILISFRPRLVWIRAQLLDPFFGSRYQTPCLPSAPCGNPRVLRSH